MKQTTTAATLQEKNTTAAGKEITMTAHTDTTDTALELAMQALHSGDRAAMRDLSADLLREALWDADEGGATEDVCEALSEEINRREVAEVKTDWCETCDCSGIRTPATVTRRADSGDDVDLCDECDEVYDDIRAENATS